MIYSETHFNFILNTRKEKTERLEIMGKLQEIGTVICRFTDMGTNFSIYYQHTLPSPPNGLPLHKSDFIHLQTKVQYYLHRILKH